MTYVELIKIFEPYKDEVYFYPASDGNNEIVGLLADEEEPFRVRAEA